MSGPDFQTFESPTAASSRETEMWFFLRRELAKIRTTTLAQVMAINVPGASAGVPAAIGTLTIKILVQQTDGAGNVVEAGTIYNVPYARLAGGANAVVIDPTVDDLGIVGFGDRDLSSVIATMGEAGPGSNRRFSWSDALWVATLPLGVVPTQYVLMDSSGMYMVSPNKISMQAPEIDINATTKFNVTSPDTEVNGPAHITGAQTNGSTVTAQGEIKSGNIGLQAHHHTAQGATAPTTAAQA